MTDCVQSTELTFSSPGRGRGLGCDTSSHASFRIAVVLEAWDSEI